MCSGGAGRDLKRSAAALLLLLPFPVAGVRAGAEAAFLSVELGMRCLIGRDGGGRLTVVLDPHRWLKLPGLAGPLACG